jgi:UDP-glucuronate 4-epimerase
MRVLVAGGGGFVGRNVVEALSLAGHEAVTADFGEGALVQLDVTDARSTEEALRQVRPHAVVNCAALTPVSAEDERARFAGVFEVNVMGTIHLLKAARAASAARFLHIGSASVFGEGPQGVDSFAEWDQPRPVTTYAASKFSSELVCSNFARAFGAEMWVRVARIATPYGPWEYERASRPVPSVVCEWASAALSGEHVVARFDWARDFTYVGDIASGLVSILESERPNSPIYHLGAGELVRFESILESILSIVPEFVFTPARSENEGVLTGNPANRPPLSCSLMAQEFGWSPSTDIREGVRRYVKWLESRRERPS